MSYQIEVLDFAGKTTKSFNTDTAREAQSVFLSLMDNNILLIRCGDSVFRHNPHVRGMSLKRKSPMVSAMRMERLDRQVVGKSREFIKAPVVINVRIGQSDVDFFREFGGGSISAGIRKAATVLSTGL